MKVGIIGRGNIGEELIAHIQDERWEIVGVANSSGIFDQDGEKLSDLKGWKMYFSKADVICICIPTLDQGQAAYEYIDEFTRQGKIVVTSEKGALGNYFSELAGRLNKIGYRATVGGKIGMAVELRRMMTTDVEEIHALLNATLNYNLEGWENGRMVEETIAECRQQGYAEPGATTALEVINKELTKDVPLKIAILFNAAFGPLYLTAEHLRIPALGIEEFNKLINEPYRRFIVTISREPQGEEDAMGSLRFKTLYGWHIFAGFRKKEKNIIYRWLNPKNIDNALVVCEGRFGRRGLIGPGAGAGPTVSSMIRDIRELTKGAT